MKLLIAEDDKAMQKILTLYFQREGYQVKIANNGQEALDLIFAEPFDLAILDWMMPMIDGIKVCKEIRSLNIPMKIMILTAKNHTQDEIQGFCSGADEYVKKPFEPQILLLRVKKLLQTDGILSCGEISFNMQTQKASKLGLELTLSKKEYALLEYFLHNQGVILTREALLNHIWGFDYDGDDRTVDTHVKRLRAKIGNEFITTHRGIGYCMEKQL